MRYLKFRNILILLEVQEIDWLPLKKKKKEPHSQKLLENGIWQTLPTVVRKESPVSKVVPEYAPISQNKTKQKKQQNPQPPSLPQLKGSWNSSAVKKAQEKDQGLRSSYRN